MENQGNPWIPKNYDGEEHGVVPLYEALARSYNLATVHLGLELGVSRVIKTLRDLGVRRPIDNYPSLFLGSLSLSPIEVAQMYQTLAAGGYSTPLRTIRDVLDQHGKPLQRYPLEVTKRVDAASVHLLNTALKTVVQSGTAGSLARWVPRSIGVAGKTGTTDGMRDSWFAGFTGDRVAVVWVGRDDNEPTGLSGSTGALQVWGNMMSEVPSTPLELTPPESVVYSRVDVATGLQPGAGCEPAESMEAPFIRGYEPLPGDDCNLEPQFFWER